MQLRQLESFVTVCRCRSFTEAARRMYLSQSAVSQHIQALEKELGCPLFDHRRAGVSLTQSGETYLPYAERILELHAEAMDALFSSGDVFYLHFVRGTVNDPLQRVILDFYTHNPKARIELMDCIAVERFASAANLCDRHLYLVQKRWILDDSIRFFALGQAKYACLLSQEDPLAAKRTLTLKDILGRSVYFRQSGRRSFGPFMYELYLRLLAADPPAKLLDAEDTARTTAKVILDRGRSVFPMPDYVEGIAQSGAVRRTLLLEDGGIGFAYRGQPTASMLDFMRMAHGCYERPLSST